jgi:hypothetical protein
MIGNSPTHLLQILITTRKSKSEHPDDCLIGCCISSSESVKTIPSHQLPTVYLRTQITLDSTSKGFNRSNSAQPRNTRNNVINQKYLLLEIYGDNHHERCRRNNRSQRAPLPCLRLFPGSMAVWFGGFLFGEMGR